jgi:two-component system chemotaxis sensor kinase CheA
MKDDTSQRAFREKIIDCFRTELVEHLQTLDNGLNAIEQGTVKSEERAAILHKIYRAAHTMKGAARAVGVTIVEQMARALESALYALEAGTLQPSRELFHACHQMLEAIRVVQITYENNEVVPPYQATMALMELEELWNPQIALQSAAQVIKPNPDLRS